MSSLHGVSSLELQLQAMFGHLQSGMYWPSSSHYVDLQNYFRILWHFKDNVFGCHANNPMCLLTLFSLPKVIFIFMDAK